MKKINVYLFFSLMTAPLLFSLESDSKGQSPFTNKPASKTDQTTTQKKFELMKRNENEDTDIYAIPFDDSEIEDEEQINEMEKKEVFSLPKAKI